MEYISSPVTEIKQHYDVIVIGSGYGGGIAASRMARAGRSVCLLERGKEFQTGEYPRSELSMAKEIQIDLPLGHKGPETGFLDFRVNEDINVAMGCGLGGTSLMNANVSVLPEPRVFDDKCWPKELRDNMQSFDEGVKRARDMLNPTKYPEEEKGYPKLSKLEAMRKAAREINAKCDKLDINVTFEDKVNKSGIEQKKCVLCGDCVTGCNYASKNTILMNYLPDARNYGAEIYTKISVKYIKKTGDSWSVYFQLNDAGREIFDAPSMFIKADNVILAAGSLGSTEILLRSKEMGLSLSGKLGHRFSGNGDTTGIGYNNDQKINGVGLGDQKPGDGVELPGPTITSVIDLRNQDKLDDGIVIEEGVIPGAMSAMLPHGLIPMSRLLGKDTDSGIYDFMKEKWRELVSITRGAYNGAVKNTITYLVNTHDGAGGTMKLENDRLRINWPGAGKLSIFKTIDEKLMKITAALGGTKIKNPLWNKVLDYDLVTVHPLGGCTMADNAELGVSNHKGQIFKTDNGVDVHEGLYVCDGAVVPRSLGANPLLTISALAERSCKLIAEDSGWKIDYGYDNVKYKPGTKKDIGIQFTEAMKGFVTETDGALSFDEAYKNGKDKSNHFDFVLTIISDNVDNMLKDEKHEAKMVGSVMSKSLSQKPLTVTEGTFNLFVKDKSINNTVKMKYFMKMVSEEGKQFYLEGFKLIHNDPGFDLWEDTTTLYVSIFEGDNNTCPVVSKGILKIKPVDLTKQMVSIKVENAATLQEEVKCKAKFAKFFSGNIFDIYSG
ncbi:MAG: GMC family oxidoreductase [Colwellia sp.]|nr:GMC family oxidoreductase [Colwellia sp.]